MPQHPTRHQTPAHQPGSLIEAPNFIRPKQARDVGAHQMGDVP